MRLNPCRPLFPALLAICMPSCGLALIPEGMMNQLGAESYVQATSEYPEIRSGPQAEMVRRVGHRIAQASGKEYEWEFKLLDAPKVPNAFCLPGGKIAIYTGILPITQTEDGLAAVMGHEVAHATLEHGNKRMTQGLGLNAAMAIAEAAIGAWGGVSESSRAGILQAIGAGAQYGLVLPYGRGHESEADIIGLRYLIRAGYDPYEAPKLWERMNAAFPSNQPAWMSTHPDSMERAAALREAIPQILAEERGQR